ncbi:hypothetical protein RHMOL_Rhmol05G0068500 [Rhododendron molle]|uniref:Uncharacterized protein n=1 Tax=Rhododendron molle TaxID=49168 RepID=A0ACC0NL16_RHOML|nr:hypothetical protein RHMOL_Rhmol05G0068500 [Rhododendron molle]
MTTETERMEIESYRFGEVGGAPSTIVGSVDGAPSTVVGRVGGAPSTIVGGDGGDEAVSFGDGNGGAAGVGLHGRSGQSSSIVSVSMVVISNSALKELNAESITVILNFSPSAYSDTYVNLTAILSAPNVPFISFLSLLQKENVIEILQTQANAQTGLTLFAPDNAAIYGDKVPWGTLSAAQHQSLLLFHALPQYFGNTLSDLNTILQLSPVTTMAGGQYTLNITSVAGAFYLNVSGSSSAQLLGAVKLTTYPTEVYQIDKGIFIMNTSFYPTEIYQIDKVLIPEGIFGTDIPPPPSTSASSTAPSASKTSTPHKSKFASLLQFFSPIMIRVHKTLIEKIKIKMVDPTCLKTCDLALVSFNVWTAANFLVFRSIFY